MSYSVLIVEMMIRQSIFGFCRVCRVLVAGLGLSVETYLVHAVIQFRHSFLSVNKQCH